MTRENGLPTRTFNFGIDGMNPPENFYVLDQILKTEPRTFKWVFVEVGNIETKSHANILGTQRLLYWHDWPRTALTLRKAFNPHGTAKWYQKLNRLWSARRTFILHLGLFEKQFTNVGRAADFLPSQTDVPALESNLNLGPKGDGYRLAGAAMSTERAEKFRRKLAEEVATARPEFIDPYAASRVSRLRSQDSEDRRGLRSSWSRRASINRQRSSENRLRLARCCCSTTARTYPQLYDTKVRVDEQHLTNEGAAEFTRLLALEFVRSARRP